MESHKIRFTIDKALLALWGGVPGVLEWAGAFSPFFVKEILYFSHPGKEAFGCPSLKLLLHLKMGLRERERFPSSCLQFLEEQEFPNAGFQLNSSYFHHLTCSKPFDIITAVTVPLHSSRVVASPCGGGLFPLPGDTGPVLPHRLASGAEGVKSC